MFALLWLPVQQTITRPPSADGVSGAELVLAAPFQMLYTYRQREGERLDPDDWFQRLLRKCDAFFSCEQFTAPPPWLHVP